jgi:hypothetical protein
MQVSRNWCRRIEIPAPPGVRVMNTAIVSCGRTLALPLLGRVIESAAMIMRDLRV